MSTQFLIFNATAAMPAVPRFAAFDTGFHATLPAGARASKARNLVIHTREDLAIVREMKRLMLTQGKKGEFQ